jgi:PAS domain S-box-containing protein
MSFFALRSSFEKQRELWASILDESCFACVMPVTPYRSFPASEVQVSKCQRTVLGIDGMMADTASLHVLLNTLVDRSRYPTAKIEFRYTLVTEDAVVAGNQMMARWVMSTLNATQFGARMEVSKQGMLCAKFNSAHKIIGLELMFDVMAFMLQLKQAAGSSEFTVVPNTVQTCQRPFKMPMVMTLAERPYAIVQVNKLWEEMTGYKAEDVVGKASCRILQGQETDQKAVEQLMSEVRFKRPGSATFVNYTRGGKRFHNFITLYPLSADSKITHYVALTSHYDLLDSRSFSDSSEVVHNAAHAPPPALGAPLRPAEGVLKPSPQVLLPSQAQAQLPGMMMPGASVLPPGMAALPPGNDSAARQVLYFQAQQGILPRPPTSQLPLLQPLTANAPTSIAPRTTETQETPAKKGI